MTDTDIKDAVMERPIGFTAGGRRFFMRPPSLGVSWLAERQLALLGLSERGIRKNPYAEALRVCGQHPDAVCRVIALLTVTGRERLLDEACMSARTAFFRKGLDISDMAQLLIHALTRFDFAEAVSFTGMDKDAERMKRAVNAKDTKNTFTFGGKSVWGSLIDKACERYGWTVEYVVWGVSLTNLRMMLADAVTSVYLSDAERKKARITNTSAVVRADSPDAAAKLAAMGIKVGTIKKG